MINVRIEDRKALVTLHKKLHKKGFKMRSEQLTHIYPEFPSNHYDGYLTIGPAMKFIDNENTLSYTPLGALAEEFRDTIMTIEELDEWLAKKNK